ncbi:MAG: hypothetical protein IIB11_02080, partial [Chloroflexi bacterium]|nr:hypothetical protein [Chloroflexota bacterium]
ALGIGEAIHTFEMLFPSVVPGASSKIDDYSLELLQEFPTLILSGFSWHSKADAEALIKEYLKGGGKVIVDLTGVQEDILSKRPKFFDVYGEPVSLYIPPALRRPPETLTLRSSYHSLRTGPGPPS